MINDYLNHPLHRFNIIERLSLAAEDPELHGKEIIYVGLEVSRALVAASKEENSSVVAIKDGAVFFSKANGIIFIAIPSMPERAMCSTDPLMEDLFKDNGMLEGMTVDRLSTTEPTHPAHPTLN